MRGHDPGLSALRRGLRAAIISPSLLALSLFVIGSQTVAVFSAFAPFVLMMFVDFSGPMRERVAEQSALVVASIVLVGLGSLAGQVVWVAGVVTLVVVFAILFCAVLSSVLAGATTSLLISFVLPATLVGPVSSIPARIAGWSMGGAATVVAVACMWPRPPWEPLRAVTARVFALASRQLRAEADCAGTPSSQTPPVPECVAQETTDAVAAVMEVFLVAPHRPTGLSTTARAMVRLVDRVAWLGKLLERSPPPPRHMAVGEAVSEVQRAAAVLLEHASAALLASSLPAAGGQGGSGTERARTGVLAEETARLETARARLESAVTDSFPVRQAAAEGEPLTALVGSLLPAFRAQRMSFVCAVIAADVELAVSARHRTWWQRLCGNRPAGDQTGMGSARQRLGEHLNRHSVWLHNSVRGAVALAIGVVLAQVTGVEHAFWVVFGTLAVLRTNAVNTGQTIGRALFGTVVGIVVGTVLIVALSPYPVVLWLLLPPAIILVGLEPSVASFTAGQAGFTIVLLILFTIVQPVGWRVGLVRVEDMALGCAVSLIVGLVFWPRGAAAALGRALCDAFGAGARYVGAAVEDGLTRPDRSGVPSPEAAEERREATAAARILDDAFRGYLAERGTKRLPLSDVVCLVNTVTALRLTGDAVVDLWAGVDRAAGTRSTARSGILDDSDAVLTWFETSGRALAGSGGVPVGVVAGVVASAELWGALSRDVVGACAEGVVPVAVREVWTADHLDALRRLQTRVLGPVEVAARETTA
ncbi:FUSC family protein [Streptomyces sp. NPDC059378]|uniref:FUSC family protein n=1 Tax=Streptomyces sp. NPDC059378 TaxID=3346815 RepID=UPI0036B2C6A6